MYKQVIIVRKDLEMSQRRMATQVAQAAMAFLVKWIKKYAYVGPFPDSPCVVEGRIDEGIYNKWIDGSSTKVILQAENKGQLLKAKELAEELGMIEDEDFFLIKDNCLTEPEPEEDGTTLTCIGFKPMEEDVIDKIGKEFCIFED